ncbi:glycosyltransferase, partial [Klebsiella aerogenes]
NSDALAQLMDKLAADPELARNMGINARQRLEEKYDLARHMQVLQALYEQLVGEKK